MKTQNGTLKVESSSFQRIGKRCMVEISQRTRSLSKWGVSRRYESVDAYFSLPTGDGVHTIEHRGRLLDLLIRDNDSETTLVVFHGSLSPRQRTIPYLQGETVANLAGVNLVSVADPSLDMGPLACAWFLGDKQLGPLRDLFSPIIYHALEALGTKQTILFGGSGGGYAAVNFAQDFKNSIAVAMNPRLNLNGTPTSSIPRYLKVCHGAMTKTPMLRVKREFLTPNLLDVVNDGQNFDLLIVQNQNDTRFLNRQVRPYIGGLKDTSRTWVSLFDGGVGHVPLPREEVARLIRDLSETRKEGQSRYLKLGFNEASQLNIG